MVENLLKKGRKILFAQQSSILSAATIIMVMIIASRVLGLVRQRTLAHFFTPEELSLFFSAFRLPDLVFEVLVFGTLSSAFIPVFTKTFKKSHAKSWDMTSRVVNLGFAIFLVVAAVFILLAGKIYPLVAPGFSPQETATIVKMARILFIAQGFFVLSYVLTGVLESLRRFFLPALAPLFYNIGIIATTILLSPSMGLLAPVAGVVIGAFLHFAVQLVPAYRLGFRFKLRFKPDAEVKKIGRLALPRVVDLSFQQIGKTVELYLASIISTASYTYFYFANTLQLLPVSLFGTSLAKAALPTLARQDEEPDKFKKTMLTTFYQIIFMTLPLATILIVLRIPIVRLVYGTDIFDWNATVQTGLVLSAFAVGVPFQAAIALLARAFYALHDTKTPVAISLGGMVLAVVLDFVLVRGFSFTTWALAASFSFASFVQASLLFFILFKRLGIKLRGESFVPIYQSITSAVVSGVFMFFPLKLFDRSVWIKQMSFLGLVNPGLNVPFRLFVLDTRYTVNLLILTATVSFLGVLVYLLVSYYLGSQELAVLASILKKRKFTAPTEEQETISPPASETRE